MTPCQAGRGREGSDQTIFHKVITGRAGLLPTITLQASVFSATAQHPKAGRPMPRDQSTRSD
jgi:hypothetical protein